MRNLVLIGGPASGKTTLATALKSAADGLTYVYMAKYAVRIPLTLIEIAGPGRMSLPKSDYICAVIANENITTSKFSRERMDRYARQLIYLQGEAIVGELGYAVAQGCEPCVLDGTARSAGVRYLKEKGFYVVGLDCSFENQVKRRIATPRDIDPRDQSGLEKQIRETNELLQIPEALQFADKTYDTNKRRSDDPLIVREILEEIK